MSIRKSDVVTSFLPILVLLLVIEVNVLEADELEKCYKTDPGKQTYKENGLRCELCSPGSFRTAHCKDTEQTRCVNCPSNMYMPYNNTCEECWLCTEKCSGLHQIVKQECNGSHPRVCGCPDGTYPSADNDQCYDYPTCSPGQKLHIHGKHDNRFKCRPCPLNTYSSSDDSLTNCKPHTNCTSLGLDTEWPGNSTHDALCKTEGINTSTVKASTISEPKATMTSMSVTDTPTTTTPTPSNASNLSTNNHENRKQPYSSVSPTPGRSYEPDRQDSDVSTILLTMAGVLAVILAACCVWYCCCKKTNKKRKCGISKKDIKRIVFCQNETSDSTQNLSTQVRYRHSILNRQISSDSQLLCRNIMLQPGKTPENLFWGISFGCRTEDWKMFIRKLPGQCLTEPDIDAIENNYRQDGFKETVYQCLIKWKSKQPDLFPLKELLEVIYLFNKRLMKELIKKYCIYEQVANNDS